DPDLVGAERAWLADGAAVTVVTPDDGRHADGATVLASDPPSARLALPSRPCAVLLRAGRVVGVVPGYRVFSNDAKAVFSAAAFFKAVNFALANARRGP
ncbi:MAG TPA: hypothetical protein VHN99_05415, partial [Deinococcales bacterium]|nr:hypothetical protein [Deinococcales bacterium]